jgi:hypothetical protein
VTKPREELWMQPNRIDIRDIARMRERGELIRKFGDASARGGRMIRGVASTAALDSYSERIWPVGLDAVLPLPILRNHHYGEEIGQITFCEVFSECVLAVGSLHRSPSADIVWTALDRADLALSVG